MFAALVKIFHFATICRMKMTRAMMPMTARMVMALSSSEDGGESKDEPPIKSE